MCEVRRMQPEVSSAPLLALRHRYVMPRSSSNLMRRRGRRWLQNTASKLNCARSRHLNKEPSISMQGESSEKSHQLFRPYFFPESADIVQNRSCIKGPLDWFSSDMQVILSLTTWIKKISAHQLPGQVMFEIFQFCNSSSTVYKPHLQI